MLKNDVHYIIKRIILAVALAFIFFFLKTNHILAATITPTSSVFDARYTTLYCDRYDSYGECIYDSWGSWQGQKSVGNTINNMSGFNDSLNTIGFTYNFSTALVSGNTYTFVNKITLSPSSSVFVDRSWDIIRKNFEVWNAVAGTTSANRSPENISSFSYTLKRDNSSNNVFYITTMITLQKNSNYVSFYLRDESYGTFRSYLDYLQEVNVTFNSTSVSVSESSNSYIQQTTQEIINQTKEIIKIFNLDKEQLNYLKDDSNASIDVSEMSGLTGIFPPGPIDSLLAIPLNLINIMITATNDTCVPFTFTFVFDAEWSLPCFDSFWSQVPNSLMLFISDVPAAFLFVLWAKSLYKRFERAVSFESTTDDEWGGV